MVAARSSVVVAHALLYDRPLAFAGDEEAVMIDPEAVLDCRGINFRCHATVVGEASAVDASAVAVIDQLVGSSSGYFALAAGNENAELTSAFDEALLERSANGGRDAARVPIESQHAAERLEPMRVGEASQELWSAVLEHDDFRDLRGELAHPVEKPFWSSAAMKRKCSATSTLGHKQT